LTVIDWRYAQVREAAAVTNARSVSRRTLHG
jgi:hypothetical protein